MIGLWTQALKKIGNLLLEQIKTGNLLCYPKLFEGIIEIESITGGLQKIGNLLLEQQRKQGLVLQSNMEMREPALENNKGKQGPCSWKQQR